MLYGRTLNSLQLSQTMPVITQTPTPGWRQALFCGDVIEFRLKLSRPLPGQAYLRTNLGRDSLRRREIIQETRRRRKRQAREWHDIPMLPLNAAEWSLTLPLLDAGHFEAKTYFLPAKNFKPVWTPGANVSLNIHPASAARAVLIYNAFTRQFGTAPEPDSIVPLADQDRLSDAGYTVIPPSGTFRDLIRQLDFIIDELGSRILMLLPIHPVPTVYGRMGRYGSPYAALDFFEVDPALAEFDKRRTPMEQFQELVDAVHARQARIWLDIAINHTGWASALHTLHPEWLMRHPDGSIKSPGAWGTVWEDLTELDHNQRELWDYLADIFLYWCHRGVDGYRCDAAYMIPVSAWEYIVARVRDEFPEVFFLLEGLGGSLDATIDLMHTANLNGAYSELFQNYDRPAVESYLPLAEQIARENGLMIHFAETHDNLRLAARSIPYARMRTSLSALSSFNGAFAFANGVEWFAAERINVHERISLNWGAATNQVAWIRRLHTLLKIHPAFAPNVSLNLIRQNAANATAFVRQTPRSKNDLLVLINLDDAKPQTLTWSETDFSAASRSLNLLTGENLTNLTVSHKTFRLELAPAEVLCISNRQNDYSDLLAAEQNPEKMLADIARQQLRAKALEITQILRGWTELHPPDPDQMARELAEDPAAFYKKLAQTKSDRLISWKPSSDCRRKVMIPYGHGILITAPHPFRAKLTKSKKMICQTDSLPLAKGGFFALITPRTVAAPQTFTLQVDTFAPDRTRCDTGSILFLPPGGHITVSHCLAGSSVAQASVDEAAGKQMFLAVNGRGGMSRAALDWGKVYSRYDALLAANLHPTHPVDRWVTLTRCRAWLEHQGYSRELSADTLRAFKHLSGVGYWHFQAFFGRLGNVEVDLSLSMPAGLNAVELVFSRRMAATVANAMPDEQPVHLVLRPDLEDRNFHQDTHAYAGPQTIWPASLKATADGFVFKPHPDRPLTVRTTAGQFQLDPEWQYMVAHPLETERGLHDHTDLFSPGYFRVPLSAKTAVALQASLPDFPTNTETASLAQQRAARTKKIFARKIKPVQPPDQTPSTLAQTLLAAMQSFIVRRDELKTVIAGYPWFLDWGRDTLICSRGLIAAEMSDEVRDILVQFAKFEQNGSLPNMISGADASNRDTSDAPLWFITVCSDWCKAAGDDSLLSVMADKRSLNEVVLSILEGYSQGLSNGIRMDKTTGLIYSPSHFTWMDTNFPAATPRAGYPVEIQVLWWAALNFAAQIHPASKWKKLARQVQNSFLDLFWNPAEEYFCDCRHSEPNVAAGQAQPDDALRPNQLLALTLGLVEDPELAAKTLSACSELLTPGAIRSLADRPVSYPLPVLLDGKSLNDPRKPYWRRYAGEEDTRRKPAYHNGTAWTWIYPSFCEAWFKCYGEDGRVAALSWLAGGAGYLLRRGCVGQLPEIVDGDYPHKPRGCDAQAWGVAEAYRVLKLLS